MMNSKLFIHAIIRQTTVLIAQISTAAGIRAPRAHLPDRVFVNLATEIGSQGVGRKVAADMFGLTLRTHQKKLQCLSGIAISKDRTLWQATLGFIQENGSTTRKHLFERFCSPLRFSKRLTIMSILTYPSLLEHHDFNMTKNQILVMLVDLLTRLLPLKFRATRYNVLNWIRKGRMISIRCL